MIVIRQWTHPGAHGISVYEWRRRATVFVPPEPDPPRGTGGWGAGGIRPLSQRSRKLSDLDEATATSTALFTVDEVLEAAAESRKVARESALAVLQRDAALQDAVRVYTDMEIDEDDEDVLLLGG